MIVLCGYFEGTWVGNLEGAGPGVGNPLGSLE